MHSSKGRGQNEGIPAKQFLAIVNDLDNSLSGQIVRRIQSDVTQRTLLLDNNYYEAVVGIQKFPSVSNVAEAVAHDKTIPALLIWFENKQQLDEAVKYIPDLNADTMVVVCDRDCKATEFLEKWTNEHRFDLVYLNPSTDQIDELRSFNEKYGIERIVEIINNCMWPVRSDKLHKVTGNLVLDRVLQQINKEQDKPGTLGTDKLIPNEAAKEAILELAGRARTPEPQHAQRVHVSSSPTDAESLPISNVSVNVEFERKAEQTDLVKISENANAAVGRKKKKKKSKGQTRASPEEQEIIRNLPTTTSV